MKPRFVHYLGTFLTLTITVVFFGWPFSQAQAAQGGSDRTVKVMTQNMDEGTGFTPLLAATTPNQFLDAVTAVYQEVEASNIPERASAVAREIRAQQPDLIGLQEVALWQTGSPSAMTVQFDSLQSLLDALKQQELHYTPVAIMNEFVLEGPSSSGFNVRVTDRDVLLARTGDDVPELSNIQQQHFSTNLTVSALSGPVTIQRGWISVDAKIRGRSFRFVTTHLDAVDASVQMAQGKELLQVPGNTPLPTVFAGDFNSAAAGDPNNTPTYGNLIQAGLVDTWEVAHPNDPGYTWPLHGEDPFTPSSTPTERIDLVLVHGGFGILNAQRIGNEITDLTLSGLWPSDHAGVAETLQLP